MTTLSPGWMSPILEPAERVTVEPLVVRTLIVLPCPSVTYSVRPLTFATVPNVVPAPAWALARPGGPPPEDVSPAGSAALAVEEPVWPFSTTTPPTKPTAAIAKASRPPDTGVKRRPFFARDTSAAASGQSAPSISGSSTIGSVLAVSLKAQGLHGS